MSPHGRYDTASLLPVCRVLHEPQGQGVAGLPGLAVYGAPVTSTQLLLLLGAGFFMGLKGLLIGGIVCE